MNQSHIDATKGLAALQAHNKKVIASKGWGDESPKDIMLMMTEEMGELAHAIRKHEGLRRVGGYSDDVSIADELADVQIYLVHLASILNIEMSEAVSNKLQKNDEKPDAVA